ncbi:MAG: 50S ribosomal protein L13 [Candidatus Sigynarchaeota archaeon]
MNPEYLLIDGKDKILGRLAAQVAKLALLGKHVLVINAKDIVISGNQQSIFDWYIEKRNKRTRTQPKWGPFFHRTPDQLFRRTCRGMLPFKMPHGEAAFKRIHASITDDYDKAMHRKVVPYEVPDAGKERLSHDYITLETLGNRFGWKLQV